MPASGISLRTATEVEGNTCLAQLRNLVLTGQLLPGEKLNQAELAERLGVSRVPIREALSALRSEGLVESRTNTGFTVIRPTLEDFAEIYLMRGLLEDALLESVVLENVDLAALRSDNELLGLLDPVTQFEEYRAANERFHFGIFEQSPLRMVRREVGRLWTLSEFYRSIYIRGDARHRRVVDDHSRIIEAIEQGDHDELVKLSDEHRRETEIWVRRVL